MRNTRLSRRFSRFIAAVVCASCLVGSGGALAQKLRVGYWTSGVSLGFGSVLEQGKFLEKEGLDVEFIKFGDVNAPTKAIASNAIDVAIGASAAGALNIAADGVPIKIILGTQIAEAQFVVLADSPLKSFADLKGKKIGMSPPGSATHAIAAALLENNYGLKPNDYTVVPGTEPRLAQFIIQKEIDAAAIRSTTVAQMNEVKLRSLGNFIDEWKKLTKSNAVPYIGIGIVHSDYAAKYPDNLVKFVVGMRRAMEFGSKNKPQVAEVLQKAANMPPDDAKAYANLWDNIYRVSFEPQDIAAIKRMNDIFKAGGTAKKDVPDSAFLADPYNKAKQVK
ncbi:MAG: Nitrate/sulfonate/bicarbonate transporter periplasmic ligand-binding protein [Betaproteobacteria bacterium]|nr:Nitrate/sulfonate/bicarbonate transporter periplasmic ligand-binding protein [Betaproteobacteria bacterium]